jgi:hypothetical protein
MTSNINTDGLNPNYPLENYNNSSEDLRDNFANIKTNLETASVEITDLQDQIVGLSSLTGPTGTTGPSGGPPGPQGETGAT